MLDPTESMPRISGKSELWKWNSKSRFRIFASLELLMIKLHNNDYMSNLCYIPSCFTQNCVLSSVEVHPPPCIHHFLHLFTYLARMPALHDLSTAPALIPSFRFTGTPSNNEINPWGLSLGRESWGWRWVTPDSVVSASLLRALSDVHPREPAWKSFGGLFYGQIGTQKLNRVARTNTLSLKWGNDGDGKCKALTSSSHSWKETVVLDDWRYLGYTRENERKGEKALYCSTWFVKGVLKSQTSW